MIGKGYAIESNIRISGKIALYVNGGAKRNLK